MPSYDFTCTNKDCGVTVEHYFSVDNVPETLECSHCGRSCVQDFAGLNFGFEFSSSKFSPGNTGVAKHDYPTADQVVGSDATKKWETIEGRNHIKDTLRQKSGRRSLARRNGKDYVEYSTVSSENDEMKAKVFDKYVRVEKITPKDLK